MHRLKRTLLFFASFLTLLTNPLHGADYVDGVVVPLVTPYAGEQAEKLDLDAFDRLIEYVTMQPTTALYTTSWVGECDYLTDEEKRTLISRCIANAGGRLPVIAGVTAPSMNEQIELARFAFAEGAAAVAVQVPASASRATQSEELLEGGDQCELLGCLKALASRLKGDLVIDDRYNQLSPGTMRALCVTCPNVVALVYGNSDDFEALAEMCAALEGRCAVLWGNDFLVPPAVQAGAAGVCAPRANVYPAAIDNVLQLCFQGDWDGANWQVIMQQEWFMRMLTMTGGTGHLKRSLDQFAGVQMSWLDRSDLD